MAGTHSNSTTSVNITDLHARPANDREKELAFQAVVGALKGRQGNGQWSGGVTGGDGFYVQHGMCWDAKLTAVLPGPAIIQFPFTLVNAVVNVWDLSGATGPVQSASYVDGAKTLALNVTGKMHLEVANVKNTKEV